MVEGGSWGGCQEPREQLSFLGARGYQKEGPGEQKGRLSLWVLIDPAKVSHGAGHSG